MMTTGLRVDSLSVRTRKYPWSNESPLGHGTFHLINRVKSDSRGRDEAWGLGPGAKRYFRHLHVLTGMSVEPMVISRLLTCQVGFHYGV